MANIKIREADSTISETRALGSGTDIDPKLPEFTVRDPSTGLNLRLEATDWGAILLPTHTEHAHRFEFNTHLARPTTTPFSTTLAAAAAKNTYQLELSTVVNLATGDKVQIRTDTYREFDYARVQAINGNIIDIDRRLDQDYPIGAVVERFTLDLNTSGSLASPVSFKYFPRPGKVQHVELLVAYIRSAANPFDSLFGGIAALTNGIHIRTYDGLSDTFQGFDVIRVNQRFKQSGWNVLYGDRASPAEAYSTLAFIRLLETSSSMRRLDSANGDYFEVLVQDNLSTLAGFEFKIAGHEEL